MEPNYKRDHKIRANKTDDPIAQIHDYDVDLQSNHIYLMGVDNYSFGSDNTNEPGVEHIMSSRFIRNMNLCMRVNQDTPIVIHMKSCGGSYEEGMAIYDTIKSCPYMVTILSYTHARSMSSIILQAANKRVLMPSSYFMFHDGTIDINGTVKQVESAVEFSKGATKTMMDIYSTAMKETGKLSNLSLLRIEKWLRGQMNTKEDVYLRAKDAVDYGLADEVFDYNWAGLTEYTEKQRMR